jgi:hypothetical protein
MEAMAITTSQPAHTSIAELTAMMDKPRPALGELLVVGVRRPTMTRVSPGLGCAMKA